MDERVVRPFWCRRTENAHQKHVIFFQKEVERGAIRVQKRAPSSKLLLITRFRVRVPGGSPQSQLEASNFAQRRIRWLPRRLTPECFWMRRQMPRPPQ
jgi:hypothetical protein